jgi:hypothetical protein
MTRHHLNKKSRARKAAGPQKRRRRLGVWSIIRYCRNNDGRLVKSLGDKRRVEFWLAPDGIQVRPHHALTAIFTGELERENDGFFGASQTWKVR